MEFIRNLSQRHIASHNCVATIGNFDGVHRGHQTVLRQLATKAKELQLPAVVVIFEPQPQEFLSPHLAPARLTRLREKLLAIQRCHCADKVLCLRFNAQFAALSAEGFIQRILVTGLKTRHLVVGDDFHFGHNRQGNFTTLQRSGLDYGFTVERWHTVIFKEKRVSSTRIREALAQGDMSGAQELLGRPYTLCGHIGYGQQRGRTIGFPTANIYLRRQTSPLSGVFAVYLHGVTTAPLPGVANLGTRPTVGGQHLVLEVHLFDFNRSIYRHPVEVEFVHKLRDEQRFTSLKALKKQIHQDTLLARSLLL